MIVQNLKDIMVKMKEMPGLGVILYSEEKGQVSGFLIASIEYLEYKGGDVYFIHHSVGLTDEIEVRNN